MNYFSRNVTESPVTPLPIIIGITGHRDLRAEDIPQLKRSVATIFRELQSHYPHTPLTMLSSLAEGADRIGAEVALEMGIDLICPLPLAPEIYRQDFTSEASRVAFDRLIGSAKSWFVLPIVEGSGETEIVGQGRPRDLQYAQVGAYHAQHSQILLALWDGKVLESIGGTGKVVHYKLDGIPTLFGKAQSRLDPVETGPVYHVLTPRESNPSLEGIPFSVKRYYPRGYGEEQDARKAFDRIFEQIDLFNTDAERLANYVVAKKTKSEAWMLGAVNKDDLSEELKTIVDYYCTADSMASYFKRFTSRAFTGIFVFVFSAALFFDLYAHLFHDVQLVLGGYLLSLVLAFLWYTYAKRKHYQTKYLDYRALAEGLRVQFFWKYIGLRHTAGDYYIRKQKSELDWIRFAMRTAAIPLIGETSSKNGLSEEELEHRLPIIMDSWVDDQAKYYPKAISGDHRRLKRIEHIINVLFYLGIALAVVQLLFEIPHLVKDYFVVATGLAPIAAALLGGFIERNAFIGHIKQYERMAVLFVQGREYLNELLEQRQFKQACDFIFELGSEALAESGDWMLLHRERPLEVPKG
ncbi:MAG TPA: hypothetical protein VEW28_06635 [Candidatus Kapabacteria bacterium]|nr:hypothetical protein [Candidatus Kapabacteria bacterium]